MSAVIAWMLGLSVATGAPAAEAYLFSVSVQTSEISAPHLEGAALPGAQWGLQGRLTLTPVQRHRDSSVGYRVFLETVTQDPSVGAERAQSPLSGRSFGFRAFVDGEVLDVTDGDRISGWTQRGDLIDLLVPLLSPAPPKFNKAGTGHRRLIWPVRVGPKVRWDNAVEAGWTRRVVKDKASKRTNYTYSGPWVMSGADKRPGGKLLFDGTGTLRGELQEDGTGAWSHSITLERQVRVLLGSAPPVIQTQHIQANISREGQGVAKLPIEGRPPPPPRYLSIAAVQPVVQALLPTLKACTPAGADLTANVEVSIGGGGQVEVLDAEGLPGCMLDGVRAMRFDTHDGPNLSVRFTVYVREGQVALSPVPEIAQHPVGPVLIHPLGAWSTSAETAMRAALGHPASKTQDPQR